jgi:hypothetical protein
MANLTGSWLAFRLGVALLVLAVGGWIVGGFKSVTKPSGRLAPRTA